jgi:hypothetical protein
MVLQEVVVFPLCLVPLLWTLDLGSLPRKKGPSTPLRLSLFLRSPSSLLSPVSGSKGWRPA